MINLIYTQSFNIVKQILSNGIVLIHNYNKQPVISTFIFLKTGTIYEPYNLSGISELLHATITKGTKTRTSYRIAEEIESLGGSISAESGDDFSTLSLTILNQNFEKGVEILSDIFFNPLFPEEEIEKEKINIIAEIMSRKDSIFNVAIDELLISMYGKKHPYGRDPYKEIKYIKKLKRKDILEWWKKFYGIDLNKKNIVIVVSGDIKFEKVKEVIEKNFLNIKKITLPPLQHTGLKPSYRHIKKKTHFKQAYLMYGYYAPSLRKDDIKKYISLKLINFYLGGGMSGKLFEVLREKNSLCYETNSFYPGKFLESHFVIYLGLDKTKMDVAKKELNNIIQHLKNHGINEEELKECKNKLKGRILLDHQTNSKQAWYLGFWEIMDLGYEFDREYIEEIEKITLDEINTFLKDILNNKNTIVELIPK
ncbi:MAG: pitrilysin family protein [Endomicrobiia bacterium]